MPHEYGVLPVYLEESAPIAVAAAIDYYSAGVIPTDTEQAMGWVVYWTPDAVSAPTVAVIRVTVQVAPSTAADGVAAGWTNLPDYVDISGATAAQTVRDWIRSQVAYKARLKITCSNIDNGGGSLQVGWLGTDTLTEV